MDFSCNVVLLGPLVKKWEYRSRLEGGTTIGYAAWPGVFARRHELAIRSISGQGASQTPFLKLNYCIEGRCEVSLPEGRYVYLQPGQAAISADCGIDEFLYPSGRYSGLELDFGLEVLKQAEPDVFADLGMSPSAIGEEFLASGRCEVGTVSDGWASKAARLHELMGRPNELEVEAVRHCLIDLFYTFMHGAFTQDGLAAYLTKGQRRLAREIEADITEDLTRTVTVAELSERLSLSPASLERYFSMVYGCPIREYLRRRRMEEAARLLSDTDMSVLDVASAVGYQSQSKFGTAFKKHTGTSPLEYRRQTKKEGMLDVCSNVSMVTSDTVTATCADQELEPISESMQKNLHIWYGKDSMKSFFYSGLRRAYPKANYRDMSEFGHAMYCIMNPAGYVNDIKAIIEGRPVG